MPSSLAPADPGPRPLPSPASGRRIAVTGGLLVFVALAIPAIFVVQASIRRYAEVNALNVLWTMWAVEGALFAAGALLSFVLIRGALRGAYRVRPIFLPETDEENLFEAYRGGFERYRPRVEWVAPSLAALFAGATAAGQWRKAVMWWHRTTFGVADPTFHRDAGFYVFTLPWLRFLVAFATMCLILALLALVAAHVVYGGLSVRGIRVEGGRHSTRAARLQVAALLAALFVVRAVAATLARYALATASGDQFGGVTYLADRVLEPALAVLAVLAACVAGLFLSVMRTDAIRFPLTGAVVYVVINVVGLDIAAPLYERLSVRPHAAQLEAVHARRAMTTQMTAFDLDGLRTGTLAVGAVPPQARAQAASVLRVPIRGDALSDTAPGEAPALRGSAADAARARVGRAIPGFTLAEHPYLVGQGASQVWVVDGYSVTNDFPGAQSYTFGKGDTDDGAAPAGVSYVRHSVTALVGAKTGTVQLFAEDPKDPILRAWQGVMGTRFHPAATMPREVRRSLRYPADLFDVQRAVLERYHPRSAADFLTGSSWRAPLDPQSQPSGMPASAVRGPISVTGSGGVALGVSTAMVGGESSNGQLRALLTAPDPQGPLQLNVVPQADASALPDPGVWSKGLTTSTLKVVGGKTTLAALIAAYERREHVMFGPVLVVSVGDGVLYAQHVYSTPQTKDGRAKDIAVVLRSGRTTVWAPTAARALPGLFAGSASTSSSSSALADADRALADMNAAQARGDDQAYQKAAGRLRDALNKVRSASK